MGSVKSTNRFQAIAATILLLLCGSLQAGVTARLSAPATSLEQPVRLTLESDGESSGSPDLTVLEGDFEILGRATQQSMSIINGSISSKRSLILTLLPKREGELTIPPISYGDQQTTPLKLQVTQQPTAEPGQEEKLAWVEMSMDKQSAYPEEEIILTLKLFQAVGVRGEHLDQPKPSNGDIRLQLLDESKYNIERDGQAYRVLELSYGLYAYQPGQLEIAPVAFRGRTGGTSIRSLFDDPFGGSQRPSRHLRAQSNTASIEIKPIPTDFTGEHWLPARNLQLVATGIDQYQPILAGKPITRRIMMIADGLTASQLPALSPKVPEGLKPYEERPQLNDTPRRTGISSSRETVTTLIPTHAGEYTLPAIEIPWWNTLNARQEIARLPEVTLEVIPSTTPSPQTGQQTIQAQTSDLDSTPETGKDEIGVLSAANPQGGTNWPVWLLAAAWLLTLAGWWLSHRTRGLSEGAEQPVHPPTPKSDESPIDAEIEALLSAYRENNAEAAKEAWLAWARRRWPEQPPNNLARLAGRAQDPVSTAVLALERAIYSPGVETDWFEIFDPALLKIETEENSAEKEKAEQLLPLNP